MAQLGRCNSQSDFIMVFLLSLVNLPTKRGVMQNTLLAHMHVEPHSSSSFIPASGMAAHSSTDHAGTTPWDPKAFFPPSSTLGTPPVCHSDPMFANINFSGGPNAGLLPIHPAAIDQFLASQGFGSKSTDRAALWTRHLAMSLNYLACVGWSDFPVCLTGTLSLTAAQQRTMHHLLGSARHFSLIEDATLTCESVMRDLASKKTNYNGEPISLRRTLVADQVIPAWPRSACLFPVIDYVSEELREDLLDSTLLASPLRLARQSASCNCKGLC